MPSQYERAATTDDAKANPKVAFSMLENLGSPGRNSAVAPMSGLVFNITSGREAGKVTVPVQSAGSHHHRQKVY